MPVKLIYYGPSGAMVFYGENCTLVRDIPSLTWFEADGHIPNPQPVEFCPALNRYIGRWCEALNSEDEPFRAPRSWFQPPYQEAKGTP
jgi:hypothetical protein